MYKVCQTIENGVKCFCTVPGTWVKKKKLHYPGSTKTLKKLRTDIKAKYEDDWPVYECVVKGKYKDLKSAIKEEKRLVNLNTEE